MEMKLNKMIHIDDGDALNIDCVVVNQIDSKDCKCFYSCDLIDQYEQRLKSDLVAMLTEIQLEIEEKTKDPALDDYDCGFNTGVYVSRDIIQQKIDKLKEAKDGENND